jgi:MFS family permease
VVSKVRRSLQISVAEGVVAELVAACSAGAVLTAWALYLRLSPLLLGVLGALPFAAQLVQLPSAWLTRGRGSRRTALCAIAIARQFPLLLVPLPFLALSPDAQRAVLLSVAAAAAVLGVVGNNAWVAWMGDLVPDKVRGRYFGRRSAWCALGATVGALCAGALLDAAPPGRRAGIVLSALALASSALGAITVGLLRRQAVGNAIAPAPPRARDLVRPWKDARARRALAFHVAWAAASGVAAAFYPIHMIGNLRMGFARMSLYTSSLAALRIVTAPLWGRAIDRAGTRPVLVACCFGLSVSPAIWLFAQSDCLWPLAIDAVLCGVLIAGQSLASFNLPISLSSREGRPFQLAAFGAAGGAATGLASAAGGALAHWLPTSLDIAGQTACTAQILFLLGGGLRIFAAALALRIDEPGARSVRDLGKVVWFAARPRVDRGCERVPARRSSAA